MNLVDFYVTRILEETRGPVYELYGMTKAQAEAEPFGKWRERLLSEGVRQVYEYDCYGALSISSKVFTEDEEPYYVGYRGLC